MGLRYLGGNVGYPLAAKLSSEARSDPGTSSEKKTWVSTQPVVTIHEIFPKNQAEGHDLTAKESSHSLISSVKVLISFGVQIPLGRGNMPKS